MFLIIIPSTFAPCMLKRITAIFLLLAFTAQTFNKVFIVLDYYINTTAFAKKCENKRRPMLNCNGKCQMMKKIKEQEKQEQQKPEMKADSKNEVLSSKSMFATAPVYHINTPHIYSAYSNTTIPQGVHPDIFHPPALI